MIAALDIRPKTRALAESRGITCVQLPATWNDAPAG
jgi:RecB family endonuclease NucS